MTGKESNGGHERESAGLIEDKEEELRVRWLHALQLEEQHGSEDTEGSKFTFPFFLLPVYFYMSLSLRELMHYIIQQLYSSKKKVLFGLRHAKVTTYYQKRAE